MGLPRALRLRRRNAFKRVYRFGRRERTALFTLVWLANGRAGGRFGITVSRRVGPAVVRNRLKRIAREALRRRTPQLGGVDLVVDVRPAAAAPDAPLRADLDRALIKVARSPETNC